MCLLPHLHLLPPSPGGASACALHSTLQVVRPPLFISRRRHRQPAPEGARRGHGRSSATIRHQSPVPRRVLTEIQAQTTDHHQQHFRAAEGYPHSANAIAVPVTATDTVSPTNKFRFPPPSRRSPWTGRQHPAIAVHERGLCAQHLPLAGGAAQLLHRLDDREDAVHARMHAGQAAAIGVDR